jgi:hypothetical protein
VCYGHFALKDNCSCPYTVQGSVIQERDKHITIGHTFIKYPYSCMIRSYEAIIIITFRTCYRNYTCRIVEVRSDFLQIYFVKYIYKESILKEVYISHYASKISHPTNIFCKIYLSKYIYKKNILKTYTYHIVELISHFLQIYFVKYFCKNVRSFVHNTIYTHVLKTSLMMTP